MQSINKRSTSKITEQNFKDICRFCLKNLGIVNIFKTKFQETILSDLMNVWFGEEICFLHEYPAKICYNCLKHILHTIVFIRSVKNNQRFLQELDSNFKKNPEGFEQVNEINEQISLSVSLINELLKGEDVTQFLHKTETVLKMFEKLSENSNPNNVEGECIKIAEVEEKLIGDDSIKTEQMHESDMEDENHPTYASDVSEKTIKCEVPLESMEESGVKTYSSKTSPNIQGPFEIITILGVESASSKINQPEVQDTIKLATNKKNKRECQCFDCLEVFESLKSLIRHTKEMDHTMPPRFQCEFCLKSFTTPKAFKTHSAKHSQKRVKTVCDICGASVLQRNFRRHLLGHKEKTNICQYCAKSFVQAGTLALHVRNEHEGKRRVSLCCICGKVFANTTLLTTHLNTHSKEELKDVAYGCEECGKYLVSEESLHLHIQKLHVDPITKKNSKNCTTKEKKKYVYGPKICPVCSKSISYIGYPAHLRMHAGIKPYRCEICSQTFKQQAHLRTHMNIHLDVKPYECRFCKKMFRHLASRRTHERAHKGEKPFKCPVCDKGFYESSPMKKHLKIHSKDGLGTDNVIYIKSEVVDTKI